MALQRPEAVPGIGDADVERTADFIVACQSADGSIPWVDGHVDPWNHIEAAMALMVGGRRREAERAFRWLARRQRADGSWCLSYRAGRPDDHGVDANFCAYIAAGLRHHALVSGDDALLAELWPVLERGVGVALALQRPAGEVVWARRSDGRPHDFALVTSSACIHLSLRKALECAAALGVERPAWEAAADRLAAAVAHRPELFRPKDEFSMDWYYPVLGGCVVGAQARVRLAERWETFVIGGAGCRCVAGRPWITAAETCELALTLDAVGRRDAAVRLFNAAKDMRSEAGGYWTGTVLPESCPWPPEQPAWTAAAVVLAADALLDLTPAAGFFRSLHEEDEADLMEATPA
jgi:hypothetical protein